MTNEEIVRNACQVIWTEGDVSRIGELYAEDFRANYPMTDWGIGRQGARNLATEDRVVVRLTIQGTHTGPLPNLPATGKSVEFADVTLLRIKDGKIIEQSGLSDYLTLYLHLGVIELPKAD
jgi:predicted ester cyclase